MGFRPVCDVWPYIVAPPSFHRLQLQGMDGGRDGCLYTPRFDHYIPSVDNHYAYKYVRYYGLVDWASSCFFHLNHIIAFYLSINHSFRAEGSN